MNVVFGLTSWWKMRGTSICQMRESVSRVTISSQAVDKSVTQNLVKTNTAKMISPKIISPIKRCFISWPKPSREAGQHKRPTAAKESVCRDIMMYAFVWMVANRQCIWWVVVVRWWWCYPYNYISEIYFGRLQTESSVAKYQEFLLSKLKPKLNTN